MLDLCGLGFCATAGRIHYMGFMYKCKEENDDSWCIDYMYLCNYIVRVIRVGKGENHNRMTDSNWVSSSGGVHLIGRPPTRFHLPFHHSHCDDEDEYVFGAASSFGTDQLISVKTDT